MRNMSYMDYDSIRHEYERGRINREQAEFLMGTNSLQKTRSYSGTTDVVYGSQRQIDSIQYEKERIYEEKKASEEKEIYKRKEKELKLDSLIAEYYHKSN